VVAAFLPGLNNGSLTRVQVANAIFNSFEYRNDVLAGVPALPPAFSVSVLGNTTAGSATITNVASTAAVRIGDSVAGPGIPGGATVLSTTSSTITLSTNATATATGVSLTFSDSFPLFGMYKVLLNRFPSGGEQNNFVQQLNNGASDQFIIDQIAGSAEFAAIAQQQ
jgi:hypothetical protein